MTGEDEAAPDPSQAGERPQEPFPPRPAGRRDVDVCIGHDPGTDPRGKILLAGPIGDPIDGPIGDLNPRPAQRVRPPGADSKHSAAYGLAPPRCIKRVAALGALPNKALACSGRVTQLPLTASDVR